ncbi:hypothetical protein OESDEN_13035 [Oesophagostomum dentatum]|uniref:HAD hydrolase, family IA, variant 3 n=1 Tax=Oesophagostomum dentatum TaxID=61180 RepID=A0A0B1STK2_OESDE|nr:hypothetical protein OESDEN_13035 [Oesophagostomum dentatum]
MKRFSCPPKDPSQVLVIEDSPNGVQAAMAAGMLCVVVPDPLFRKQCQELNATQVLSNLEEFRPEEFGLPSFN